MSFDGKLWKMVLQGPSDGVDYNCDTGWSSEDSECREEVAA